MNTLAEKVEKLLINNDCVVVPAFGGFIKNKKSAAIVGQKIVPPQVEVSFNSMLCHDDGLLCSLIARENNISYRAAMVLLSKYTESLRDRLLQESQVDFGNIGSLSYRDGTATFRPKAAYYLPENFGLRELEADTIRHNTQRIGKSIEVDEDTITINISDIRRKVVRYAALVAVIILISIFVPDTSTDKQYAGFVVDNRTQPSSDRFEASDKALAAFAEIVENTATDLLQDIDDACEEPHYIDVNEGSRGSYHIVVASFGRYDQAEDFCHTHRRQWENISILQSTGKPAKYRCVAGSYDSLPIAIEKSKLVGSAKSWVLFQKL